MKKNLFRFAIVAAIVALSAYLYAKTRKPKSKKYERLYNCAVSTLDLNVRQSDSLRHIIDAFDIYGDGDKNKLAYIVATAYHESRLSPIKEIKGKEGTELWDIQKRYWPSGYYGRGFVQITWKGNYQKMSDVLGVDLVENPDLALNSEIAAKIIVIGMINGMFTGHRLGTFINDVNALNPDFYAARAVVGAKMVLGKDTAKLIEGYAKKITQCL